MNHQHMVPMKLGVKFDLDVHRPFGSYGKDRESFGVMPYPSSPLDFLLNPFSRREA